MQIAMASTYFLQAVLGISWLPRIPELIDQIHVSFEQWGLIIGLAGVGSFAPLLLANKLISRVGTRPIIQIAGALYAIGLMFLPSTSSWLVFFIIQLAITVVGTFLNIAINAQAVMLQKAIGRVVIGRFHASWSVGASITAALSGWLASFLPLQTHMVLLPGLALIAALISSIYLMSPAEDGHAEEHARSHNLPFFKSPAMVWLLSAGLFAGVFPELVMMDWSAVFAKTELGLNASLGAVPYAVFTFAMIIGRLLIGRISRRFHVSTFAKWGGLLGGTGLAISIWVGPMIAETNKIFGLVVLSAMWFLVGFGFGPLVPSFFSAAGYSRGMTTTQVLSRMSLVNQVVVLGAKIVMGAVAQRASVATAFIIPTVLLFVAGILAGEVAKRSPRADQVVDAFPPTGPLTVVNEL